MQGKQKVVPVCSCERVFYDDGWTRNLIASLERICIQMTYALLVAEYKKYRLPPSSFFLLKQWKDKVGFLAEGTLLTIITVCSSCLRRGMHYTSFNWEKGAGCDVDFLCILCSTKNTTELNERACSLHAALYLMKMCSNVSVVFCYSSLTDCSAHYTNIVYIFAGAEHQADHSNVESS